ncbi:exported hypothetical protein [Candidatus Terasakiella magnetica]|uniref:Uncharacterized protein n=1 Tax=Candidatus Terasakiella magnetica TaxID=1867952 RepID=A0A1C3RGC2_9PROT|nr:hypothetical protein [Candidatus Terasakiella magnetica]SCA56298.1 exported hypothetical protein [Candidatus Terasakiella magnetica]
MLKKFILLLVAAPLILIAYGYNVFHTIYVAPGQWDENIREIGNVINFKGRQFFYYSGKIGANAKGDNQVFCGVAEFKNNKWKKLGKIGNFLCEDPYALVLDDEIVLLYEEKIDIPDLTTSVAKSTDGISYKPVHLRVLKPTQKGWQNSDTSSPILLKTEPHKFALIYEARGEGKTRFNQGSIAVAFSDNPYVEGWIKPTAPSHEGTYEQTLSRDVWNGYLAPDDVIKVNDEYIFSFHALSLNKGWSSSLWKSTDLQNFTSIYSSPLFPQEDTVMIWDKGTCIEFLAEKEGLGVGPIHPALFDDKEYNYCSSYAERIGFYTYGLVIDLQKFLIRGQKFVMRKLDSFF